MIRATAILLALTGTLQAEPLRIGTETDYRPYIFIDEAGNRDGFDVDLMAEICARGDHDCTWVEVPFNLLFSGLAEGRFDLAIGGVGATPERDRLVDWTRPYRRTNTASSSFAALDTDVDLDTARVGVQGGTVQEELLRENGYSAIPYISNQAAIDALFAGEVDVFFGTSGYLAQFSKAGETPIFDLGQIDYADDGPQIAVAKSNPALRDSLNALIEDMLSDGTITLLDVRWFPSAEQEDS
ncbi:MAG: transporter substrate-binding domain-containing protein [Rhodobacter sp.]|nr:transporter substrate-binding domain-containing protein [Rhodobacter sp.]